MRVVGIKKKLLFGLSLLISSSIFALADGNYLLLSTPRSGSSWFSRCLSSSEHLQQARRMEYFNPIFWNRGSSNLGGRLRRVRRRPAQNSPVSEESLAFFTATLDGKYNFYNDFHNNFSQEDFETALQEGWVGRGWNYAKDVFMFFRLPYYLTKFKTFMLYRHRKHTMKQPNDAPLRILLTHFNGIGQLDDPVLNNIYRYILDNHKTEQELYCGMHIFCWFIYGTYAAQYNIPIMEYTKIMTLDENDLEAYLRTNLPEEIYSERILNNIVTSRKPATFLEEREESYLELGTEPFCEKLLDYMKPMAPNFEYWDLLT